ncbi:ATP-binding cassette domain-containing protein [Kineosporia mesophila]|uniref:ATP-binding cassette domain-containing protein n=1 Tax=Kineosporia mesophila TaxID=566012 RepID=A0ABP6YUI8_9ACTN|nr:ABC transporter ATP-binding protein [Kineosporia mesophila]MCD5352145.1 ABC transporter ATP-binding protein/permease [Kineosporia mesophila]
MRLLRDLWQTSPRQCALVMVLVLCGGAGQAAAAALAGPVLLERSWSLFVLMAAGLSLYVLGDLAVNIVAARLTADWSADLRRRLCTVAFSQPLQALEGTPVGELLDRIDQDIYQVGSEIRNSGLRIFQQLAVATVSIVTALFVWWPAGVGMLLVVALTVKGLSRPIRRINPARMSEEEAWSDLAAVMEESIHGQDDVRTTLARPYVVRLFADRSSQVLSRGRVVWRLSAKLSVVASTIVRSSIAVVVVGGIWALQAGHLDAARLTSTWLLALAFGATVDHISRMVPHLQQGLGAWGRVQMLSASTVEPTGGEAPAEGELNIRNLTFAYPGESDRGAVLHDVSLTFVPGRSYALIGRTGSGKSTLAKVLTRSVDVPDGTVDLGGADLNRVDLELLRRWVAVVPQRTEILAGSLAENIALFDPELIGSAGRVMDELGLGAWVEGLPDGLGTRLGEGGYVLSAGQEQLVAFGRILVRDPHLVILDEATARMDPVTEHQVQLASARLLEGRIGIVIAHRLSSVADCDEVVVLDSGRVLEAGPLARSQRFARLVESSKLRSPVPAGVSAHLPQQRSVEGELLEDVVVAPVPPAPVTSQSPARAEPPQVVEATGGSTVREIFQLVRNDARYGVAAVAVFMVLILLGLDGSVLPWLWADLVDGSGSLFWPSAGIVTALLLTAPLPWFTDRWFPEWWVRQTLRINLRLTHGQTGDRRVSNHTPAAVIAQSGDTERVVQLADNVVDNVTAVVVMVTMTAISGSIVPALFFAATMVLSGIVATGFGPKLEKAAARTVAARASFATALVSSLSAARTVKLSGATQPVLSHLAGLDRVRSERQREEIMIQVWSRSTPALTAGLLPIGAWALYLNGGLSPAAVLIAVSTLGSARWFAWTTASFVSQLPSARVWTRRTHAMIGEGNYSAELPEVDVAAGTAPAPVLPGREPLRELTLTGFTAVHEDGMLGARDVDLTVRRGELVLVVGPVGAGKSSLLRALAGIVHHWGSLAWNGTEVTEPERFLRPNQVGYVGQVPRVLSGTIADNIALGHDVDLHTAVAAAQLERDLAESGSGLGLMIGHKGSRLSGGQLQRLALARALAPRTELLVADDVSSALDVGTELDLWQALREHGVTVVGSTSKRAALERADRVVVMIDGRAVAQGTWAELDNRWSHLAG